MCGLSNRYSPERLMDSARIVDGDICFPSSEYLSAMGLFETRFKMHKQIYGHAVTQARASSARQSVELGGSKERGNQGERGKGL